MLKYRAMRKPNTESRKRALRELRDIAALGGTRAHELQVAHTFTAEEARISAVKRSGFPLVPSRKRGARYEYFVEDPTGTSIREGIRGKWVTRQRIYQLRRAG